MVQAMGGVTFTCRPKTLTRCWGTHAFSRRFMVHKVRGIARSSAVLSIAASASIGTAISEVCLGVGATSVARGGATSRSEEHTSELQSLMRISYAVFCLKKKKKTNTQRT